MITRMWKAHGTKVLGWLGTLQAIIGIAIGSSDLIPPEHLKYWLFVSGILGLLTVKRGHTNTHAMREIQQ